MQKPITSHISIAGIFITLLLILTIPLVVLTTQNPQDLRQRAASPQLIPQQPKNNNYISGYIYLDQNENGEREFAEPGAANIQLQITENPDTIAQVTTDQNGYFKYSLLNSSSKEITVHLLLPITHKTLNLTPRTLTIQNNQPQILEFGIFPLQTVKAIQTNIQPPTDTSSAPTSENYALPATSPTIFHYNPPPTPIAL